jgi:myb proto-oncogene protein
VRKQWDEEEDIEVVRLVKKYGKNWKKIEEEMQGRSGKQIRERFINKLDPAIKHEKFSEEEDRTVYELY